MTITNPIGAIPPVIGSPSLKATSIGVELAQIHVVPEESLGHVNARGVSYEYPEKDERLTTRR